MRWNVSRSPTLAGSARTAHSALCRFAAPAGGSITWAYFFKFVLTDIIADTIIFTFPFECDYINELPVWLVAFRDEPHSSLVTLTTDIKVQTLSSAPTRNRPEFRFRSILAFLFRSGFDIFDRNGTEQYLLFPNFCRNIIYSFSMAHALWAVSKKRRSPTQ